MLSLSASLSAHPTVILFTALCLDGEVSLLQSSALQRNQRHYREEREREDRVGECASIRVHVPAELKREKEKESLNEWSTRINEHSNGAPCPVLLSNDEDDDDDD